MQSQIDAAKAEKEAVTSQPYKDAIAAGDTMAAFKLLAEANPDKYMAKYEEEKGKRDKYEESAAHQAAMQFDEYLNSPEGQAASPDDRNKKQAQIYGLFKSQGGARLLPPLTEENKHWQAQALANYEMPVPGQLQIAREQGWDGPDGALEEAKKINPELQPS